MKTGELQRTVFVMVFAWTRDLDPAHSNKMANRE